MNCPRCRTELSADSRFCASCGEPLAGSESTQTMAEAGPIFAPGDLFAGRYRIIDEAGRGGMGIVYKAIDTKIEERIALKILAPEIAHDPRALERFRRELKSARLVTHKNVLRVHDLGESEGIAFLTMEFAPGQTLKSILAMAVNFDPKTALNYARQICDGLAEAHRAGIIHRDLKPQNLMIDDRNRLRIMDFGIARPMAGEGPTREGVRIGTPSYMAPEQAEGRKVDARTDLYAVGAILYEMLTGRLPFERHPTSTPPSHRKTGHPPPPSTINPLVPASLDAVIQKCLAEDPGGRFASAEALNEALASVAAEIDPAESAMMTPPPLAENASRRARRGFRPAVVAAGLIAAAALTFFLLSRRDSLPWPEGWDARLAVLPMSDTSPARDQAMFCNGMTHDLRDKLGAAGGLKIISEFSSNQFVEKPSGPTEIGRILGARHILDGRLNLQDGVLSVKVLLGDARTGRVWTMPYNGRAGEYFAIQDQIVADVMEELKDYRASAVPPTPSPADPASIEAYTEYLMGRRFESRYRELDAALDFEESARFYRAALAHDPRYTLAFRGLGDLHEARFVKGNDPTDLAIMLENFRKAFDTNPRWPDAIVALGWSYFYQQNPDEAYRFFRQARDAAPDQASVLLNVGAFLRSIGLFEKAVAYLQRAIEKSREIDPLSISPAIHLASCQIALGRTGEAEKTLRATRTIDPANTRIRILLAGLFLGRKDLKSAQAEIDSIGDPVRLPPTLRRQYDNNRIWLAAARGDEPGARQLIQSSDRPFSYEIINAYCALGLKEEALAGIRDGLERGFRVVKDFLYRYPILVNNPALDVLRGDPRFQKILATQKEIYDKMMKSYTGL
jgi:serine/threonine-protein kinase